MVEKELLLSKLLHLEERVTTLRQLRTRTARELLANSERQWAVLYGLQIAIQIVLDIGNHILASEGGNAVDDYASLAERLGLSGILPVELATKIRGMAGLRNLLVHEYVRIDLEKIQRILDHDLVDFATFAGCIRKYLETR